MRIVQIANFVHARSGGIRIAIDALSSRYVAAGHDVMIVRPGSRHHLEHDELGRTVLDLPGVTVPASGGYRVLLRRSPVASVVAGWRPDVVEVNDQTTLAWVGSFARDIEARSVMFSHERLDLVVGDHLGAPRLMRCGAAWHHRRSIKKFDLVLFPSRFAAAQLDHRSGVASAVVPLGVDLDQFHPDRRRSITRAPRPHRILMASRLTSEKQPLLALRAVTAMRDRGWDVELLVAGTGPLHQAMVAAAARTGGGVRMLSHVDDRDHLAALLADADAVVCPGRRETFGLAALEALASGTPVVGVDESAIAELVVDGTGVTCRADPTTLADGLARVLGGDRAQQRAAARRHAEQFRWDRTATTILDHYRTLTNSPASSKPARNGPHR